MRRTRHQQRVHDAGSALLTLAVGMILGGLAMQLPLWIAGGTAALGLGLVAWDLSNTGWDSVTPMTVYAFATAIASGANMVGLLAATSESRPLFFLYTRDEYLMLAMQLTLAGLVVPTAAFRATLALRSDRPAAGLLPKVDGTIPDGALLRWGLLLGGGVIAARTVVPLTGLGTITAFLWLFPQLVVFALARRGAFTGNRRMVFAALALALMEATRAAMFAFLRNDIIAPIIAFVIGTILGARSLRVLRKGYFLPIYAVMAVFIAYFGAFGARRSQFTAGVGRIEQFIALSEDDPMDVYGPTKPRQTVLSRLTTFNQLTQIGRVVEEDGHLNGATLEYLGFAFIPRVLWPEKPKIAKGAWFALRIGQARVAESGAITNSVNMTVPGELFLNFGWLGVFVGLSVFGWLLATLWHRASFWGSPANTLGSAFGYYILWIALTMAADLQIVVSLIAMYVQFVAGGWLLGLSSDRRPSTRVAARATARNGYPEPAP